MQDREKFLQEAIGRVVHKVRKQKNLKFTIFCYENDISKTTLYMIEKGKCSPYTTTLYEIIRCLGIGHEEFGKLLDKELPKNYWDNEI